MTSAISFPQAPDSLGLSALKGGVLTAGDGSAAAADESALSEQEHTSVLHRHTWERMAPMLPDSDAAYTSVQLPSAPLQRPQQASAQVFAEAIEPRFGDVYFLWDNAFTDSLRQHVEVVPFRPQGFAGDPLPYSFRTDDFVTTAIMLSFFLMVYVISRGRRYLADRLRHFFFAPREQATASHTENELRGSVFLVFQTCFTLGVLMFDYVSHFLPEVFNTVSPYLVLLAAIASFGTYYLLKTGLYVFVNSVFFDRRVVAEWTDTYLFTVFTFGVLLFPVALLVVYFDMSFSHLAVAFFIILALTKLMLLYKCFLIFSRQGMTLFHIILYLCALEITPPLVVWRSLTYLLNALVVID